MLDLKYWDKCAEFHGHKCPGLAIGFAAVNGAIAELGLKNYPALDEEIVCVTENDACCVDAIQVLLGCTYGKSNLIPHIRGKMAFSFYVRDTGASVRLVLKNGLGDGLSREAIADAEYSIAMTSLITDLFVKTNYLQNHPLTLMSARGLFHPGL